MLPPGDSGTLSFRGASTPQIENAVSAGYMFAFLLDGRSDPASVLVAHNPWRKPEGPPQTGIFMEDVSGCFIGDLRGLVRRETSAEPVFRASTTIAMRLQNMCGNPLTESELVYLSVETDENGEYFIDKSLIFQRARLYGLEICRGVGQGCPSIMIEELQVVAPGFRPKLYLPREAARFQFLRNSYRRDFLISPKQRNVADSGRQLDHSPGRRDATNADIVVKEVTGLAPHELQIVEELVRQTMLTYFFVIVENGVTEFRAEPQAKGLLREGAPYSSRRSTFYYLPAASAYRYSADRITSIDPTYSAGIFKDPTDRKLVKLRAPLTLTIYSFVLVELLERTKSLIVDALQEEVENVPSLRSDASNGTYSLGRLIVQVIEGESSSEGAAYHEIMILPLTVQVDGGY